MNSKEKCIAEAYGEYWERLTEEQKNYAFKFNGCVNIGYSDAQKQLFKDIVKSGLFFQQPTMPKSLKGIKNNNGWIKIDSEADLPKETGWYDFQVFPQEEYKLNTTFWHKGATKIGWFVETYTHYQPIEKPKSPLY